MMYNEVNMVYTVQDGEYVQSGRKINRKYGSISFKIDKNEKWYKSVHIVGIFYHRVYNFSFLIV
jgi:hypothetical protein